MNGLKAERLKKRLTQEEVAQAFGISRAFYALIEIGARRPTFGLASHIADYFGVEMEVLFFEYEGFKLKRKHEA